MMERLSASQPALTAADKQSASAVSAARCPLPVARALARRAAGLAVCTWSPCVARPTAATDEFRAARTGGLAASTEICATFKLFGGVELMRLFTVAQGCF